MTTIAKSETENPFDPAVIERKTAEVNAALDAIQLSDVDRGLREWIPGFYSIPFERLRALDFLLRRARGEVKRGSASLSKINS